MNLSRALRRGRQKKESFILIKLAIFNLMLRYAGAVAFVLGNVARLEKTTANRNDIILLFTICEFRLSL